MKYKKDTVLNERPENLLEKWLDLDALARGKQNFDGIRNPLIKSGSAGFFVFPGQTQYDVSPNQTLNFSSASAFVNTGLFGFFVIGSLVQYLLDILLCGRL